MKRFLATFLALCAISAISDAQILQGVDPEADSVAFSRVRARMDSIRQYRPTVALVLSGGGARGLAHLGVIRLVEELGIPVDIVTGTSMGGLIAGLYSLGYDHKQLDTMVRAIDWPIMMSDKIPDAYMTYRLRKHRERFAVRVPFHYDNNDLMDKKRKEMAAQLDKLAEESGTSTSDVLQEAISRMGMGMPDGLLFGINVRNHVSSASVGYQDSLAFSDLPIAFACVATDMTSLRPKYWNEGNIVDAIRSTISIPFYFRSVRTGGEILVDGGMRDNYPVDLAKEMGADIIIGSEMVNFLGMDEINNPVDLVLQSINLLGIGTLSHTLDMPDVNIHHSLKDYNMMSFDDKSVDNIIAEGYQNALVGKEKLEAVAEMFKDAPKVPRPATALNLADHKVLVGDIEFEGLTPRERKHILNKRVLPIDRRFDREDVESLLDLIYGTNAFESVTYRMEGKQEPYTLVFECQKGQVNELALGVHADTDEYVYLSGHLGLGTRRISGFRLTTDVKLGGNPCLIVDAAYKPMIGIPTFGVSLRNQLLNTVYTDAGVEYNDKLFSMGADAYMEDSRMTYGSMRMGISYEMNPYEHFLASSDAAWKRWDWKSNWISLFGKGRIDTFDDGYFPTKGLQMTLDGRLNIDGYKNDLNSMFVEGEGEAPLYIASVAHLGAAFTLFRNFTILPSVNIGWNTSPANLMNPRHAVAVGGTMPGRYVEHQIPFFGFATGYHYCLTYSSTAQIDLRYCFSRKNFVTLRAGAFKEANGIIEYLETPLTAWAAGAEYARQSVVGPIKIAAQWCDQTGFTISASLGFDF